VARRRNGSNDGRVSIASSVYGLWRVAKTRRRGSIYEPAHSLDLTFHPYSAPSETKPSLHDPHAQPILAPQHLVAQKILNFASAVGSNSFWRFMIEIPLQAVEMTVRYRLNNGAAMDFVVPALYQNFRWAAHSCNGKSSSSRANGYRPDGMVNRFQFRGKSRRVQGSLSIGL
jgi:hypothetical protein